MGVFCRSYGELGLARLSLAGRGSVRILLYLDLLRLSLAISNLADLVRLPLQVRLDWALSRFANPQEHDTATANWKGLDPLLRTLDAVAAKRETATISDSMLNAIIGDVNRTTPNTELIAGLEHAARAVAVLVEELQLAIRHVG